MDLYLDQFKNMSMLTQNSIKNDIVNQAYLKLKKNRQHITLSKVSTKSSTLRKSRLRKSKFITLNSNLNYVNTSYDDTFENPMKVVIAGPPASGKGTQCEKIVEKYGLVHLCVGDLLREEVAKGTERGIQAKLFMDNGNLVPNRLVVDLVKDKLNSKELKKRGWLLDGYPRSLEQAMEIENENIRPNVFILLEVPDDEIVGRVVGRCVDPVTKISYHRKFNPPPKDIEYRLIQRSDDTEEKVVNRLNTYHSNLESIRDLYEDLIQSVDGNQSIDDVFESISYILDQYYSQVLFEMHQ